MIILIWILQIILIAFFTMAAVSKITNSQALVDQFDEMNLPQWFRIVTGWVEVIGAVLLIIGFWSKTSAVLGALLFIVVGVGGILSHIRSKDNVKGTLPIIVLTLIATLLFLLLI